MTAPGWWEGLHSQAVEAVPSRVFICLVWWANGDSSTGCPDPSGSVAPCRHGHSARHRHPLPSRLVCVFITLVLQNFIPFLTHR